MVNVGDVIIQLVMLLIIVLVIFLIVNFIRSSKKRQEQLNRIEKKLDSKVSKKEIGK